jgi:predicted nucleotidyltransferase
MNKRIIMETRYYRMLTALIVRFLPGVKVLAFGSRVNGRPKRYSDIDLAAWTAAGDKTAVENLREAFDDSDLPFRVDFWEWDKIPESWKAHILAEGTPL